MSEFWRSDQLPQLESRRSCQEATCYRPHSHDRFSIGVIDCGTALLTGVGDEAVRLLEGDVIVIPAGHVHACNPELGRWRYQMIHADAAWSASLLADDATSLLGGISILRGSAISDRVSEFNDSLFAGAELGSAEREFGRVLLDCARLEPVRRLAPVTDPVLALRLAPVLEQLRDPAPGPVLDELAELVGMSKYELIRATRRATGLSPVAWRQNHRIIRARGLLRDGRSLAETAAVLGFADQSHFHRVFRAHVAATPGAYRG